MSGSTQLSPVGVSLVPSELIRGYAHDTSGMSGSTQLSPVGVSLVPSELIRGYAHTHKVNNYLVGKTLRGSGTFTCTTVKEGLHVLVGEKVAIKILDKKKAQEHPEVAKNFCRQATILHLFDHPNIVRLLEVIETDARLYHITELCSGGELVEYIHKKQKLDENETCKFMRQIVSAVDHFHKAGIIHRDLKARNILLNCNMDIKIVGTSFGMINEEFVESEDSLLHQCNPFYAAPERLGLQGYGKEVDIWSIGVNMYAMLTGSLPYTVEPLNITALRVKMLEKKMNPIPQHLSSECKDLLDRLLNPNPSERITMVNLTEHTWMTQRLSKPFSPVPFPNKLQTNDIAEEIVEYMVHVLKVQDLKDHLKQDLLHNKATPATAVYHLIQAKHHKFQTHIKSGKRHKSAKGPSLEKDATCDNSLTTTLTMIRDCPRQSSQKKLLYRNSMVMVQSFRLSSSPLLILCGTKLVAGTCDGMVWYTEQNSDKITAYFEVAGQIADLSIRRPEEDVIAVGSAVVQLVRINDTQPLRTIYRKANERLMVPGRKYLVSFLGKTRMLATAQVHGNSIDIWDDSSDTHVNSVMKPYKCKRVAGIVMKPHKCITVAGKILSISASPVSDSPLISVVSETDTDARLMVYSWEDLTCRKSISLEGGSLGSLSVFFSDGRNIAVAKDNQLKVYDATVKLDQDPGIIDLDDVISCLSSANNNLLGVGLVTGNFIYVDVALDHKFSCNARDLHLSNSPVVSLAMLDQQGGVWVAQKNGLLQLWKVSSEINSDHQQKQIQVNSTLGMELHKRGIISVPETVKSYTDEMQISHGVFLTLPLEVESEEIQIETAFRPCGLSHFSFDLPKEMIQISQAVWLCTTPEKKFKTPAKVKLEHCFECENEKHQKLITFLKADHDDITRDENDQIVIRFKAVDINNHQVEFSPSGSYGILHDNHFCIYCLAVICEEKEIFGQVNYCLTIMKPVAYPRDNNISAKIYCLLHFDLDGCKQLVHEQTPESYALVEKQFQFEGERYEAALEMEVDDEEAKSHGWNITTESDTKILAENVNFFNYRNTKCLERACKTTPSDKCYPHAYPPRFIIEVSRSSEYSCDTSHSSTMTLKFNGAKEELRTQIQLRLLRDERDLAQPRFGGEADYHYRHFSGEPYPFYY